MNARHAYVAASLLPLVLVCGCNQDGTAIGAAEDATPTSASGFLRVQVVQPEVTTLRRTTTQPVTVYPYHQADIEAKVSGYVSKLSVDIGDEVKRGDVLAMLDVPEMEDEIAEQEAVLSRLHAEERQAVAAEMLADADITAAQAALEQAEAEIRKTDADLKAQQLEFERIQELVQQRSVESQMEDESRQRLESAEAAKSAAEAARSVSRANVTVAEAKSEAAKAEVARAKAEIVIAERQRETMRTLMKYASLTAPFDGVVTARNVDLGDLVSPAPSAQGRGAALFTLAQLDRVRVRAAIPEADAPWTTVGDSVTVKLSALRSQPMEGSVSRLSKSLDTSTRTMIAEIDLENPDGRLLPGMYGEATIILDEKADALVLPAGAVRFNAEGHAHVYLVNESGVVHVTDVTTGIDDGHHIEIESGLSPDALVVDGMLDRLSDGQQVEVSRPPDE